jgi:Ser/Thr protein kinase RdoA (MazF antagonist)
MSNVSHDHLLAILAHWFTPAELPLLQITEVAVGLSRATLWKVTAPRQSFCVRRSPRDHSAGPGNLIRIHRFMEHTWRAGFRDLPQPKRTLNQQSFVEVDGAVWELASWLPGAATRTPNRDQAKAAAGALACFHSAGASFHQLYGCPPGLRHRLELLGDLQQGELRELKSAVDGSAPSETREIAHGIIAKVEATLSKAIDVVQSSRKKLPVQWCLADAHIGNFLFVGDHVTGIVDFATAGVSSVAQDIARLIGSIVPHLDNPWRECVDVYRLERPLTLDELRLIFAFHVSGTIGAAANWLRWRFIDDVSETVAATTQARLIDLAARLELIDEAETALSAFYGPIA